MSNVKSYKESWEKISDISRGGQGATIKAISLLDKNTVAAVKILHSQNDIERRARMQREAVALTTLCHHGLPKVLDSNTEFWKDTSYKLFIATEYIPGSTLSDFDFRTNSLSEKIKIVRLLGEIIKYCHLRGVLHRDIKPDNIILKDDSIEQPIIIDFGISFNFQETDNDNLTPDGQHLGNRFLILPEQKVGEVGKRDFRTDVTCLVGIFYYLLTNKMPTVAIDEYNRKPHQRTDSKEVIESFPVHQREIINYIFDIGFNQLIDKRWQTVQSFIEQLDALEKAMPNEAKSTQELIALLQSKTNGQPYQEAKLIGSILNSVDSKASEALVELHKELGSNDWGPARYAGGGLIPKEQATKATHLLSNSINPEFTISRVIYGFITGNEIVGQILHNNVAIEVLRQPISSEINWEQYKARVKSHFLDALVKRI